MRALVATVTLILAAACNNAPLPIRLQGDPVSIAWLAGAWDGEYWGGSSGRRGTLSFDLASGTDSLFGDVMMMDPTGNVLRPADASEVHRAHVHAVQHLRVDLVSISADTVRGVLEPYVSPDCGCVVTTTFIGQARGDEIQGTYQTRGSLGALQQGFWKVRRTATTRP